jgi:glycosyltransferase involved in cell wall biosynthesis
VACPKVICLTPVKNEAWILERFLKCASLWADHIIIADQGSDDGSREIARGFSKVTLIDNSSQTFNEPERQKLLINAARQIPGPRLLLALDADEFITANCLNSMEWQSVLNAPAGTVIRFEWPIILSDMRSYWMYPYEFGFGFIDDGSEHEGTKIHSQRVPFPQHASHLFLKDIKVMHYAFTDLDRAKSKSRWYQCWEMLNRPEQGAAWIFRFHQKDMVIPDREIKALPTAAWLAGYEERGIDMKTVFRNSAYRWDREVLELFEHHGTKKFKKLDIWNVNWSELQRRIAPETATGDLRDPRSVSDKVIHRWLRFVQPYYSHYNPPRPLYTKIIDKLLKVIGW